MQVVMQATATSTSAAAQIAPLLTTRGIVKDFGATRVLSGIDLDIAPGELVAIIGPSGSGKSTLLRCLNRLEEPTGGTIHLNGHEITGKGVDLNKVRRGIGMVFQAFNLYPHLTAERNVSIALSRVLKLKRADARARAIHCLAQVGLEHKAQAFPAELSGGQQQRVAIARSMAMEPALYLFDEPTSALDPELVSEVLAVMRDMRRSGATMIVVTHEMTFAREAADRVIFMDEGAIVETGTPDHVFARSDNPRLTAFLRTYRNERLHA
jgi:ABC-type polar amino acid transport system ATPase subunit